MASQIVRNLYRQARKAGAGWIVGEHALSAWSAAKTLRQWQALEDKGLVRLTAEVDQDYEWYGDGPNPCPNEEAYGSVGEFCLPTVDADGFREANGQWKHADSVWGHVGYRDVLDWRENPYILDIMSETIDAFRIAWKDAVHKRCPVCHQPKVS